MKCIKILNCYSCPYMNKKNKTCSISGDADVSIYNEKYPIFCTLDFYPGYKKIEQQIINRNKRLKEYNIKKREKKNKEKFYNACIGVEKMSANG